MATMELFSEWAKNKAAKDILAGGRSTGLSIEDIAEKHGIEPSAIEKQLKIGRKIEREHTDVAEVAEKIAKDHLAEIPDYYDRLVKMEKEAGVD